MSTVTLNDFRATLRLSWEDPEGHGEKIFSYWNNESVTNDMCNREEVLHIVRRPDSTFYLQIGNHTPGRGRFAQARSDWDVVHPGRAWAEKCTGKYRDRESIILGIKNFLAAEVCNIDSPPMDPGGGSAFE